MNVMRIAICDDETVWHEKAKMYVENFAKQTKREISITYFYEADSLLTYNGHPFDAIFMDIELEGANGIKITKTINEKWPDCSILYVTNHLFYATDVYQTDHIYFVLKEQFEKKLPLIFDKLEHLKKQATQKIPFALIGSSNRDLFLSPKDIYYFERDKRRTYIHTIWGTYETWEKISALEARLPKSDFTRCHNSYIVYFPAIREISNLSITLKNDVTIAISRNYNSHTKKCFAEWAMKEMLWQ